MGLQREIVLVVLHPEAGLVFLVGDKKVQLSLSGSDQDAIELPNEFGYHAANQYRHSFLVNEKNTWTSKHTSTKPENVHMKVNLVGAYNPFRAKPGSVPT